MSIVIRALLQCMGYECSILLSYTTIQYTLYWLIIFLGINEKVGVYFTFALLFLITIWLDMTFIYASPRNRTLVVTTARCGTNLIWCVFATCLLNSYCEIRHVFGTNAQVISCAWDNVNTTSNLGYFILMFYIVTVGRSLITGFQFTHYLILRAWKASASWR